MLTRFVGNAYSGVPQLHTAIAGADNIRPYDSWNDKKNIMKRIVKKYSHNRILLFSSVTNAIIGAAFLGMYFAVDSISNDIMNSNPVVKFLLLPGWLFLELFSVSGLAIGVPCSVCGIICLILVAPYLGRMHKIRKARRKNGRKIPKELLEEMLETGELDKVEYERELAKYAQAKEKSDESEEPKISAKDVLLRIVGAALVLGIMIGLPVAIGYFLDILH